MTRPLEKVSAAKRKLNSSLTNGVGMGHTGNSAVRMANADRPQSRTLIPCLRATAASARSALRNHFEPSCGQVSANSSATEASKVSGPKKANIYL